MICKVYLIKNRYLGYYKKNKKIKLTFILISFILIFSCYLKRIKEPSICLCLIPKKENRYIR